MPFEGSAQSLVTEIFDQVERACEAADLVDETNSVSNGSRIMADVVGISRLDLFRPCASHLLAFDRQSEPGLVGAFGCSDKTHHEQYGP
jgi:hypothetical protein